jgi:hypothetical protein
MLPSFLLHDNHVIAIKENIVIMAAIDKLPFLLNMA